MAPPTAARRSGRLHRGLLVATLALGVGAWMGLPTATTLAILGDSEVAASSFATETLDPPTNLNATATLGLIVDLTWTATVDTRATGYLVLRGTASGGPYSQVGTVTSRTTTTFTDLPLVPGTYYYVLRTYFGSWTSVNSNEDSVLAL